MIGHNVGFYAKTRKVIPKLIDGNCKDNQDMPDLACKVCLYEAGSK